MKPNLENLKITEKELETLTGLDVDDLFVGGVLGGVFRPSIFQKPQQFISFCITEIIVAVLVFILTIPIGLSVTRNFVDGVNQLPVIWQFLEVTIGITLIVLVCWHLYMWFRRKHLKTLLHLLNEVDKYNEVIQAVDILDRLEAVGNSQVSFINRNETLEALRITRDSLVSGLMTEKILRETRSSRSRRYDLLTNIENNLANLRTLEVNNQANEYGQLLNEALEISLSVHQEVKKFSRFSSKM